MKILILKPSSLGDVVQALPVLRLLKRHFPQSEIYWWLNSDLVGLLEDDPDLHGIFPFHRKGWSSGRHWRATLQTIQQMRQCRFDWVIDLQGLARSGLIGWLSSGQTLIGLEDRREGAFGFYDITVPRPSPATHAVDWYLQVLTRMGVPISADFTWLPARTDVRRQVAEKWQPFGQPWLIIHPGARWANKRWPAEFFAEAIVEVARRQPSVSFAILGNASDRPLGRAIASAEPARCLDLTGKTSLTEMIEWIRLGELMLTNDTGPMHIAAALQKPVVAIFGPTDWRRTGPYRQASQVLQVSLPCSPCLKSSCHYFKPLECLRAIPPQRAADEVDKILSRSLPSLVCCPLIP